MHNHMTTRYRLFKICPILLTIGLSCGVSTLSATTSYLVTDITDNFADTGSIRYAVLHAQSGGTIGFQGLPTPATITLINGPLPISVNLTINGPGPKSSAVTISGNNSTAVFQINSGVTVTLSLLTIANGSATNGGGILNNGNLTVNNCTLSGNSATGGAINNAIGATLTVNGSTLTGNSGMGNAIYNNAKATVINSTFLSTNNDALYVDSQGT